MKVWYQRKFDILTHFGFTKFFLSLTCIVFNYGFSLCNDGSLSKSSVDIGMVPILVRIPFFELDPIRAPITSFGSRTAIRLVI